MGVCFSSSNTDVALRNSNKVSHESKPVVEKVELVLDPPPKVAKYSELFPTENKLLMGLSKFYEEGIKSQRKFTYAEIMDCTQNFSSKVIGSGGFGQVYEGYLKKFKSNGKEYHLRVAVKRLDPTGLQSFNEWLSEVVFLRSFSHPHIVTLLGYCTDNDEAILVYEFMANGSLDKILFSKSDISLSWKQRISIAYDTAKGLNHLHCGTDRGIIFRDFKTGNILLDKNLMAKLSDFGLAKDGPQGDNSHVSTRVVGSTGYLAPEYLQTGHLTFKTDVYAFGVVLLELISGRRAIDLSRPNHEKSLLLWAQPFIEDHTKFHELVDPRVMDQVGRKSLRRMVKLVQGCISESYETRYTMDEVLKELSDVYVLVNIDLS